MLIPSRARRHVSAAIVTAATSVFVGGAHGQWATPADLSNDLGYFALDPSIDFDAAGKVHVAYQNFLDSVGGVWYTNNVSGSWLPAVKLVETGGKPSGPNWSSTRTR